MVAYYNEIEHYPAQWMRNLITAGQITPGYVDERDIRDVKPDDLLEYRQCHFFAGIAGWSAALRLAGWPDDEPVWTGSCPCQPFSIAGRKGGTDDARHLWPDWFRLIKECRPRVVFGEQVASKDGLAWLDIVYADLENAGYTVAALDLCAASVGAPHIRQRLYFVAVSTEFGRRGRLDGDSTRDGWQVQTERRGVVGVGLAHANQPRLERGEGKRKDDAQEQPPTERGGGFWDDVEWIPCKDGKARPTKPGVCPVADVVPGRMEQLRAYGNAIVPVLAAEFIKAFMDFEREEEL